MAKYLITGYWTYRDKHGTHRHVHPAGPLEFWYNIFDTEDPARGVVDITFIPPVVGVEAMDEEARTHLAEARRPYVGRQVPGIGYVSEPKIMQYQELIPHTGIVDN